MKDSKQPLVEIPTGYILKNEDNPRLIFRKEELTTLMDSIRTVGILVPLTVYKESRTQYRLLDGERRWRAAKAIGRETVPAVVQPKPTRIENILRMFNIHNVREQWDPMASAIKLELLIRLLTEEEGRAPSVKELSSLTGLTPSAVRRLQDLIDLPPEHRDLIMSELRKPKSEQKFSEDFFYEMNKAVKTVQRYVPEVLKGKSPKAVTNAMMAKYSNDVINNVVAFRQISRIARGEKVEVPRSRVVRELKRVFEDVDYKIETAYAATVEVPLEERQLKQRVEDLTSRLGMFERQNLDPDVLVALRELRSAINDILS